MGRERRVHGGCAWVTEDPSTEARHQEEEHQGNRRDSEVTVCAVRSFRPSYSSLSLHSYSPVSESDRPIIAGESKAKDIDPCFLPSIAFQPNVGSELKFREHREQRLYTCQPTSAWPKKNRPPRWSHPEACAAHSERLWRKAFQKTDQPLIVNRDIT